MKGTGSFQIRSFFTHANLNSDIYVNTVYICPFTKSALSLIRKQNWHPPSSPYLVFKTGDICKVHGKTIPCPSFPTP